jgi:hypothetical protein
MSTAAQTLVPGNFSGELADHNELDMHYMGCLTYSPHCLASRILRSQTKVMASQRPKPTPPDCIESGHAIKGTVATTQPHTCNLKLL